MMNARRLLLLNLSRPDPVLVGGLRSQDWDLKVLNSLEELSANDARPRYLLGLVVLGEDASLTQVEKLPSLCPIEWVALVPPALLEDSQWAAVIARNFHDYHTLPAEMNRLSVTLGHSLGRCALLQSLKLGQNWAGRYDMIGHSAPMQELYTRLDRTIKVDAPVLITGESGTGKELVARAIHKYSSRRDGEFIAVNCGGLAENLIQTELFGHEKGAFTGALQRKVGSIEAAAGGVVFLDEIGDLPLTLQANLLRFLQEKTIVRVGSTQPVRVDVRVIAATHVNLLQAVSEGKFREDLYYRLNVVRIDVPPLRQREEDIELLAEALFNNLSAQKNPKVRGISSAALAAMRAHNWPGNVRELINRMQQAMIMSDNRLISTTDLDLNDYTHKDNVVPLQRARDGFAREVIRAALQTNQQNVSKTARDLGVSRVTLYRLFEKFAIERP